MVCLITLVNSQSCSSTCTLPAGSGITSQACLSEVTCFCQTLPNPSSIIVSNCTASCGDCQETLSATQQSCATAIGYVSGTQFRNSVSCSYSGTVSSVVVSCSTCPDVVDNSNNSNNSLSNGAIAGISIGAVALAALIIAGVWYYYCKQQVPDSSEHLMEGGYIKE